MNKSKKKKKKKTPQSTERYIVASTQVEEPVQVEEPESPVQAEQPEQQTLFQAVGVIKGNVVLDVLDSNSAGVEISGKTYQLSYAGNHRRAYDALKKEIENTGITQQRLIVYPKVTHFPGGRQPYSMGFQLAGFVGHGATGDGLPLELEDLEFKLSGLWQFIPVCRTPCISVFRNFNRERLAYIKQAPLSKKVNFMKASHVPIIWKDAPVSPFKFNPRIDKEEQGKAMFVQVKARFNSSRNIFEFVSLLGIPKSEPPSYLKAGKKDKAEAAKQKLAARKAQQKKPTPAKPRPKVVGKV